MNEKQNRQEWIRQVVVLEEEFKKVFDSLSSKESDLAKREKELMDSISALDPIRRELTKARGIQTRETNRIHKEIHRLRESLKNSAPREISQLQEELMELAAATWRKVEVDKSQGGNITTIRSNHNFLEAAIIKIKTVVEELEDLKLLSLEEDDLRTRLLGIKTAIETYVSEQLAQLPQFQGLKKNFVGWELDRGQIST